MAVAVAVAPSSALAQEVSPPVLVSRSTPVWPEGEPRRAGAFVIVLVDVDALGRVTEVTVEESSSSPRIDAAATIAARALRFEPARRGDEPVAAQVRLRIDVPPPPERAPELPATLRGTVLDAVTRRPIARARVEAVGRERSVQVASDGAFSLETRPGPVELRVTAPGYRTIGATETLVAGEALEVRYALTPATRESYETVVVAPEREEVGRRTLQHVEVRQTPGTMGDPFRVIETLPGVVPIITGVPYYYVRGAPPADTGYFLDGVRVPALFHLALGPSVVHPNVVDRIDFYAGGAPARYPGFVGGIVGATTAPIPRDRLHLDVDVRLIDAGAIVTVPFDEGRTRVSASGRYSYTAALLSLASPEAIIDYWDYQVRVERDLDADRTASVFAFGSFDLIGEEDPYDGSETTNFAQTFHRIVGNHRWKLGEGTLDTGGAVGVDIVLIGEGFYVREYTAGPRAAYTRPIGRDVDLTFGFDATYAFSDFVLEDDSDEVSDLLTDQHLIEVGTFLEGTFRASRDLTLLPGVRVMALRGGGIIYPAADPRLGFRRALGSGFVLKGSAGWYHQRPAFIIPLPGLDSIDLARGLQRSIQVSQGLEWDPGLGLSVDAQVFFHRYDNLSDIDIEADGFPRLGGNAYGLEVIVRRALTEKLFGWVAYTLSRSERRFRERCEPTYDGYPGGGGDEDDGCSPGDEGYVPPEVAPSDFDRTHVANLVLSYELPRHFRIGGRLQYRSGRPYTPLLADDYYGSRVEGPRNSARMPGYAQLDLRIDKRWTYDAWNLELYFEFINVTFSKEAIEVNQTCDENGCTAEFFDDDQPPIVIPTFGVRGVF